MFINCFKLEVVFYLYPCPDSLYILLLFLLKGFDTLAFVSFFLPRTSLSLGLLLCALFRCIRPLFFFHDQTATLCRVSTAQHTI